MDVLHTALLEALSDAPYQVFTGILADKFAEKGVVLKARERSQLCEHLRSDPIDDLHLRRWPYWADRKVAIEVTDEEIDSFESRFTEFLSDRLPSVMLSVADEVSVGVLQTLHKRWPAEKRREDRLRKGFEKRLEKRWHAGLESLGMFLEIAREFGEAASKTIGQNPGFAQSAQLDLLTRLHARACQVADEILCLLSSGFADGAMARWRTLHEIAVVALFLKDGGDNLAVRYRDHDAVESFAATKDYMACSERLGYEPISEAEFRAAESARDEAVRRHGDPFKHRYGWAAQALDKKDPTFSDIEKAVGIDHLRAHYRMASHNVHSNPKGVFFKLGLVSEKDTLLAGPSNAGLADPGHAAAISLLQSSVALGLLDLNLDSLVALRILSRLADEVGDGFIEVHQELEREEQSLDSLETDLSS
jgi:hypothetical protein